MSFFDRPDRESRSNAYFAAMNSHRGFVSYFPQLFAPYRKYVIKGGPGSGKSTLMKKLASKAEDKELFVERYYCSSDTASLDAVVIPSLGLAVLDGTPPHTTEPSCPGAVDRLLDLTRFWNNALLTERAGTVAALNEKIGTLYRRVYALMKGIYGIECAVTLATETNFDKEHAARIVNRLLDRYRIGKGNSTTVLIRPASAFGVKGYLSLDSYERQAKTVVAVKDRSVFSEAFFAVLREALDTRQVCYHVAPRPIDEKTESLYLPDHGILFTRKQTEDADGIINLDRMLPERGRKALSGQKALLHKVDELCLSVKEQLSLIGKLHDELETHYIAATDHIALNAYTEELIAALLV